MFRFIGIGWTPASAPQSEKAAHISQGLCGDARWQPALRLPGLHVFTTGQQPGINGVHPLPANRGVVLGRVFRRRASAFRAADPFAFSAQESDEIIRSEGRSLVEQYWGRYVAFLPSWDGAGRVLRDPSGTLPCFQVEDGGVSVVFSWLEDWLAFDREARLNVSWEAIAFQLLLGQPGGAETALEGVTQVLPGQLTRLGVSRQAPDRPWNPVTIASPASDPDPAQAARDLHNTVATCVQAWGATYERILLRLSGGVDSAILLSALCRSRSPDTVTCINYHSRGASSDERSYARLAAQLAGTKLIEQERDSRFRLETVLDVARTPTPGCYLGRMGTGRLDIAAVRLSDAKAMFTGSGGDQLFYELRSTWPASDSLRRHGLGRRFMSATLDAAHLGRVSFWAALRRAFADRSFAGDPLAGLGRYVTLASREATDLGTRHAHRFIHPLLDAACGLPIGKYHHLAELITAPEYFDPYLREASPEVVAPLRSQPLMELCLALPTYTLTRGGRGRALARHAFSADIPVEIAARQSKGSIDEHVNQVLQRHAPLARELLLDGRLAGQGLLDRQRVDAALSGAASATDTYASEIHNCIAIEAWLQRMAATPVH